MNVIILATFLLSSLLLKEGKGTNFLINNDDTPTVRDKEKSLQKKWEEFDKKWMEDAHKKRRNNSTSLQDLIHLLFHSGGRKDGMKSKFIRIFLTNFYYRPSRERKKGEGNSSGDQ